MSRTPSGTSPLRGGAAIGAVIGILWFAWIGGLPAANPTNLDWISGDRAQHLIGWLFFRNEPPAWPLGRIGSLLYPVGTTLGFTDSNPWLALLLRPLSSLLPVDFQFIGPWLLLCFALQGTFAIRIMETLTPNAVLRVLGAAVFVLAPALAQRMGHDTLTAHWLILAMIWLHLRAGASVRNTIIWTVALNFIAAGVHPYLAAMLLVLGVALFVKLARGPERLAARTAALWSLVIAAQTLVVFVLLGYLGRGESLNEGGFGTFSADILAFINPMGDSPWLPMLPMREGQYEGYAYLGIGVIVLAIFSMAARLREGARLGVERQYRPLLVACALLWVFALSNQITIAGYTVLTVRSAYDPIASVVDTFRASGRFVWPLYYLLIVGVLTAFVRLRTLRPVVLAIVCAGAVTAQAAELRQITYFGSDPWPRPQSPAWAGLDGTYRHLAFYPAHYPIGPSECQSENATFDYRELIRASYLAYAKGLTFNSGYVARASMAGLRAYCKELNDRVAARQFAHDTVYIVTREAIGPFLEPGSGATCGVLDGFRVCVSDAVRGRFHRLLQTETEAGR